MGKKVLFLIFAVAGIAILIWGFSALKKSQDSRSWPSVEGVIVSSEVDSYTSTSGSGTSRRSTRMYAARISYGYTVNGAAYTSKKVSFGDYSSSVRSAAQKIVDKYPPQAKVAVYYNPNKPAEAILEPGKTGGIVIPFVVGGMFVVVGLVGAFVKQP